MVQNTLGPMSAAFLYSRYDAISTGHSEWWCCTGHCVPFVSFVSFVSLLAIA